MSSSCHTPQLTTIFHIFHPLNQQNLQTLSNILKKTLPQFPAHEIPDKDMDAAVCHVEQLALSSQNLLQTVSVSSWPAGSKAKRAVADEAGNFCNRCDSEGL